MKRINRIFSTILASVALFSLSACGDKDEWDGVFITDNSIFETMQAQTGIVNPPTVVCDLTTKEVYETLSHEELKPASVILRLNDHFNVVDTQGKKLCSFSELYQDELKNQIIPIIYLSDEEDAKRAIELFSERYDLLDAAVISANPAYVKTVRKACSKVGGIVEFRELDDVYDAVRITNANLASVAVIGQNIATAENVFYLQSRFRTVWVRPQDTKEANLYDSIDSGAFGIVSEDHIAVLEALGNYDEGAFTRMPFVVAHRGLPNSHNENSVSGAQAAIAAGATHLEADGYLTRDHRIAIMHDGTIERTSNGEGSVEDFNLAELQQYSLDLFSPAEPIPSLDDIFEAMKGSDIVLLFEIKTQNVEIVNALKTALTTHNMERQVVVITYHTKILEAMARTLPEIPTANLSSISETAMDDAMLIFRSFNTGTSTNFESVTPEMNTIMRDRGIIGWYWTYDSLSAMTDAISLGYTGLTTNVADEFLADSATKYAFVKGDDSATATPVIGEEIAMIGVTYQNKEERIKGKVFYAEDLGDKYAVIASYSSAEIGTPILYTQTYSIKKS